MAYVNTYVFDIFKWRWSGREGGLEKRFFRLLPEYFTGRDITVNGGVADGHEWSYRQI